MMNSSATPYRKPTTGGYARCRYTYWPPTSGNRDASSAHTKPPISATPPPISQTSRMRTGSATTRATLDGFAKIPTPTMPPATTTTESRRPSSRRKPACAASAVNLLLRAGRSRRRGPLGRLEPRDHLVAHREVIQRARNHDRAGADVLFDDALVVVEIRVMRMGVVLDRILAEPDARQSRVVERRAVGPADVAAPGGRGAEYLQVLERLEHVAHDRRRRRRAEDARAARTAGAAVDVEIRVERREFGLRRFERSEVLLHVRLRSEQPFFLAAPQGDADRPARRDAQRLQDPRSLHHHRAADRVVGRAGRGLPRVEMAAEHQDR